MKSKPVFRSRFEKKVWSRLDGARSADDLVRISDRVIGHRGSVGSQVLTRLMEDMYAACGGGSVPAISRLVSKSRPGESRPALTLASIYADIGDPGKAGSVLESVDGRGSIPLMCSVRARICLLNKDAAGARKELMRARCSDPVCREFYDLIQGIEPSEGWMHRYGMERLAKGEDPMEFDGDGAPDRLVRLYRIYRNWYRGSRDSATAEMIGSEEYAAKDPEYILASARMSVDERDWHSAQMMYRSLVSGSSNCAYILSEAADAFYRGGNPIRASELYLDAMRSDPGSLPVMLGLIRAYLSMDMKAEASSVMEDYLASENSTSESYIRAADAFAEASMYTEAAGILDVLRRSYPDDPQVCIRVSVNESALGDMNAALDAATDAVRSDRKDTAARSQRARVLIKAGNIKGAASELRKARRIDPEDVGVMLLLKDVAVLKGNNKEAVRLCNAVLELDPGNAEASDALSGARARVESKGKPYSFYRDAVLADYRPGNFINVVSSLIRDGMCREAADLCYENDREFGGIAAVLKLRGNAEYALKDYARASASFALAAAADPRDPVIWHSKGMADESMGDLDAAEEAFNKAVLMNLDEPEFWISRSSVQDRKGDSRGAVESLNRAIGLRPDSAYALMRKGMIFANSRNFEEALYFIDMALIADPDIADADRIRRDILIAAGSYARALEVCLRMMAADPSDADSVACAVAACIGTGDIRRATEISDEAIRRNPGSAGFLTIKRDLCESTGDAEGAAEMCRMIGDARPDGGGTASEPSHAAASGTDVHRVRTRPSGHAGGSEAGPVIRMRRGQGRDVPDTVKRQAERILRRAYTSRSPIDDPDLLDSLDIGPDAAAEIAAYLSDIPACGEIIPGTPRFDRMERLSSNAVLKGRLTGIDSDPTVPVECAYAAGAAKDADEAKALVSYIRGAMAADVDAKVYTPDLLRMSEGVSGVSVYEIMRESGVGVYRARAIMKMR